jgi:hypothetical protein
MKMLNQHFSEKSCINIFREKTLDSTFLRNVSSTFFNIFHKNVDQHFPGKNNIFPLFSTFKSSPVGEGARRPTDDGVAQGQPRTSARGRRRAPVQRPDELPTRWPWLSGSPQLLGARRRAQEGARPWKRAVGAAAHVGPRGPCGWRRQEAGGGEERRKD